MRKCYYRIIFLLIGIFFAAAELSDDTESCPAINFQNEEEYMQPTTAELIKVLTDSCRYDPQRPPPTENDEPVRVYVKVYFYFLKSYEAHNLQFTVYMLLQCRFKDQRLSFDPEVYNVTEIVGTKEVSQLLWMPHVYFHNERHSMVMGPGESDVMTHIIHDGTVLYTKRIHTTLFCWMKLQKFPFDSQECTLILDSWSYNMSYLTLEWENEYPVHCRDQLTLTEFSLIGEPIATEGTDNFDFDQDASGDFQGNYSSLVVTFHLQRESGFYIYDYFIPSILLVVVSWVSFWLEADALPGRVTLGSSTMLTFIILALQTGNSLPKVSYVKASEIWFLGCTGFIFGSLVEFAFVNTIWRSRRKKIQLKKVNSKYILKQTLTPKAKRKDVFLERSTSCPYDMNTAWGDYLTRDTLQTSSLGVGLHKTSLPNVNIESVETVEMAINNENREKSGKAEETLKRSITDIFRRSKREKEFTEPTLMTPKEVSNWIDNRSRVVFPVSFLIFNVIYWSYVYYF